MRSGFPVGLDNVTVDVDGLLAQRLQVDNGSQTAADEPLNLNRSPVLPAAHGLAWSPVPGRARQQGVLGRQPATAAAAAPAPALRSSLEPNRGLWCLPIR